MGNNGEECIMIVEPFIISWSFVDFIRYLGACQIFLEGRPVMTRVMSRHVMANTLEP